jgi:hypothetical protein
VRRAGGGLALAVLLLAAGGCALDERAIVTRGDSTVIGSFESGNDATAQADDPRFGVWSSYSYGTPLATVSSSVTFLDTPLGCHNSNWCFTTDFQLADVADGAPGKVGVGDRLAPVAASIDLSALSHVVFSQRYLHDPASCRPADLVTAIFRCDALHAAYQASASLSQTWVPTSIAFGDMVASADSPSRAVALSDCLAHTSAILFQLDIDVLDGACASGTLGLDTVSLR